MFSIKNYKIETELATRKYGSIYIATKNEERTKYAIKKINLLKIPFHEKKIVENEVLLT